MICCGAMVCSVSTYNVCSLYGYNYIKEYCNYGIANKRGTGTLVGGNW